MSWDLKCWRALLDDLGTWGPITRVGADGFQIRYKVGNGQKRLVDVRITFDEFASWLVVTGTVDHMASLIKRDLSELDATQRVLLFDTYELRSPTTRPQLTEGSSATRGEAG